jgi:DNA-binding LacI/PurR family transcriptional regulator
MHIVICLAGFDDTDPLLDDRQENMLTTVRLPLDDIGREAAWLLISRSRAKPCEARTSCWSQAF